jgi:hypothetical protein
MKKVKGQEVSGFVATEQRKEEEYTFTAVGPNLCTFIGVGCVRSMVISFGTLIPKQKIPIPSKTTCNSRHRLLLVDRTVQ